MWSSLLILFHLDLVRSHSNLPCYEDSSKAIEVMSFATSAPCFRFTCDQLKRGGDWSQATERPPLASKCDWQRQDHAGGLRPSSTGGYAAPPIPPSVMISSCPWGWCLFLQLGTKFAAIGSPSLPSCPFWGYSSLESSDWSYAGTTIWRLGPGSWPSC